MLISLPLTVTKDRCVAVKSSSVSVSSCWRLAMTDREFAVCCASSAYVESSGHL